MYVTQGYGAPAGFGGVTTRRRRPSQPEIKYINAFWCEAFPAILVTSEACCRDCIEPYLTNLANICDSSN